MKEFVTKDTIKPTKSHKAKQAPPPEAAPKDKKRKLSKKERIEEKRKFKIERLK